MRALRALSMFVVTFLLMVGSYVTLMVATLHDHVVIESNVVTICAVVALFGAGMQAGRGK